MLSTLCTASCRLAALVAYTALFWAGGAAGTIVELGSPPPLTASNHPTPPPTLSLPTPLSPTTPLSLLLPPSSPPPPPPFLRW